MSAAAAAEGLRLRIGYALVDASAREDVARAIAAANEKARIVGLVDALNPAVIDPAKARALLEGLAPDAASVLGGRALDLDAGTLRISTASPTVVAAFAAPVRLVVESEHGASVTARAEVAVDCGAARAAAAAARVRAGEADRAVAALELGGDGGAISAAKRLRYVVALAWSGNAGFAAACAPGDAAAVADREAALAAAQRWMILGGSMQ